jgi:hypothetical protein
MSGCGHCDGNSSAPTHQPGAGTWRLLKVADTATCSAARTAVPCASTSFRSRHCSGSVYTVSGNSTMANPHPWLDVSTYPILVVRYPADADRRESATQVDQFYDAFCAWADARQVPYTVIADTTAIKTMPSALVRAAIAKGEARTAVFEARLNKGTAVVVANNITRGVATAVFWLSPPAYPMRVFATFADALAWILARLDSHGLQRPATLPRAI